MSHERSFKPEIAQRHRAMTADKVHAPSRWLFQIGLEDYMLARLGYLHANFSSMQMAAQAVEKYLKGLVLRIDGSLSGSMAALKAERRKRTKNTHDLPVFFDWLCDLDSGMENGHKAVVELLSDGYARRYPDGPKSSRGHYPFDLDALDQLMFAIWDRMDPVDDFYFLTHGLWLASFVELMEGPNTHAQQKLKCLGIANKAMMARARTIKARQSLLLEP